MADFYVDLFGDKKVYTKDGKEVTKDTKIKKKTGFFQTPALFDDGYQFGDITGTILGTAVDTTASVVKGAGSFVEGMGDSVLYGASEVADFLGADSADKWLKGVANTNLVENAFAPIDNTFGRASIWGDTSSSVLEGVGQVGAMIAIGKVGNGLGLGPIGTTALTSGSMFTSSLGSGISEAYQNGATDGEAWAYGTMKGGIDAATEMLFGGLGKAVKAVGLSRGISSLDDIFARKASSKISNHVLKNAVQYGIKASGEGLEEVLAGYGTAVAKKLTYASDEELEKLVKDENLLEQFIVGAMTSGIVQSPQLYHSAKTGTDFVTGYTKSEESVVEAVVQERVKELESEGKKVSRREVSKIYDEVQKSLEKGYIDTDKIESIIGGDSYKNYKDLEKKLEEAEKEYDKYHNMPHGEKTDAIDARQKELASEIESLKKQISDAREPLFRTLDEGIKGTRLSESYREGERASEKFEADLDKYENEFARKTIENYMARNFNNTNRSHDRAEFMAKLAEDRGRVYGFTTTAELEESIKNGNPYGIEKGTDVSKIEALESEKNGVILVNMDANKSFNSLIGHETTHTLEKAGLYGDLQEAVFELAKDRGEYDDRLASIRRRYANLSEEEQMKELTADLLGDYIFSDTDFVKNLSTERPNLFKRILEEIKHLLKLAAAGSKEARDLERVRHTFENVWRDRGKVNSDSIATRFSLVGIENGIEVYETSEETKKLSYKERKQILLRKMQNEFFGRTAKFTKNGKVYYAFYNEDGLNKGVYGDNKSDKKGYKAKINIGADGNYIELAENSLYDGSSTESGKTNKFHEDAKTWDYFVKKIKSDGYYFDVLINVKDNGNDHYVYDITLKKATSLPDSKESYDGSLVASNDSIPHSSENASEKIGSDENLNEGVKVLEGGTVSKLSLSSWTPETQGKTRENLITAGYEVKKVDKWIADLNSVASVIASDRRRLDFEAADNQTMLKNNQDYVKTLDASTLCAKRLPYQGTFNAIQHRLPNTVLSSDDLIMLQNMMKEYGYEAPCSVCYVESRRRHLGKFAQEWLDGYNGEYKPNLDEITTSDGLENLRKTHPQTHDDFIKAMKKKGSSNPKVVQLRTEYRNEIMSLTPGDIEKIEAIGGLRVQSFSDFETPHLLDMMQAVMDMSAKGLTSQAYTKVPNFAWVFGDTGIKINLSLIAEGDGFDADGNLAFSSVEGMDINDALALRDAYSSNVGTIIVGANDKHILACMSDDRIDFIIPFHRSGWGQVEMDMMGIGSYEDYSYGQNEHDLSSPKKVVKGVQQYAKAESNLYPPDYWDYTLSGKENAERYLNLCAKTGREPKFSNFLVNNGDGTYSLQPDGSTDGYWKTLIDFKMYDNDGNGAKQQKVQPIFNMEEAYRVLNEYEGGANSLPVADDVVEKFVAMIQNRNLAPVDTKYSLADSEGNQLTKGQQEFYKDSEARDDEGRLLVGYHGTDSAGFTIFDFEKGKGRTGFGVAPHRKVGFFTTSKRDADSYGGNDGKNGGKIFDPNEVAETHNRKAEDHRVGEHLRFDTKEDADAFLKKYPMAKYYIPLNEVYSVGSEGVPKEYAEEKGIDTSEEWWEDEAYDEWKDDCDTIFDAYRTYEAKHSVSITIKEFLDNPQNYSLSDLRRAMDAYDENNAFYETISEGYSYEEMVDFFKETIESDESEGYMASEISFFARPLVGQDYTVTEKINRRTYACHFNLKNPLIKDYEGRYAENTSFYSDLDNAIASGEYDGFIAKNCKVGRYKDNGTIICPFSPNQIKSVNNENPTDDSDIRNRIADDDLYTPKTYGDTSTAKDYLVKEIAPTVENAQTEGLSSAEDIAPVSETKSDTKAEGTKAKILTSEPESKPKKNRFFSKVGELVLDKGLVFENLAKKTKNRQLEAKWDFIRRSEGRGQRFIGKGADGVRALDDIRKEIAESGNEQDFSDYIYHLLNIDRMSLRERFKVVGNKPVFGDSVTANDSRVVVKDLEAKHPDFKKYADEVYAINRYLRQMLVDGNIITKETADLWEKMYPHFVPISRVQDMEGFFPTENSNAGVKAPVKRATGGNADIRPLFDVMAERVLQTYKAVAKNNFGIELKNTIGNIVESEGTDVDGVDEAIGSFEELIKAGSNGHNPTFTVFEDGKKVTFEIDEVMYDALKPTSDVLGHTNKTLNKVSKIQRGVLTEYNPAFLARNAIKDAQDVLMNSQHPAKTYANFPKAIREIVTNGKWYEEYMNNGGDQDTYFEKDTSTFKKEQNAFFKTLGIPFRGISAANNVIERMPRLAEYIASRKSGRSIEESMLDSARVTTNFAAGGDLTKFLNRNGFTFLNASVQGAMQNVRNFRDAKMNGLKGVVGLATKFAVAGLPMVLLNNILWDDDEEYEELSDYVKENYYIVGKMGDGQFVRIPKGRTVSVIQKGLEQMSNLVTGDDEADFGSFLELAVSNLAPNNPLENNIIAPILQVANNETWYGEKLVPTRLEDLPSNEQYDESTDSISRWFGDTFGVSPYKVNYLLNQYTGVVGDVLLPMLTPEAESGDNSLKGNLLAPVKDAFTTDSVFNNQNVSDFYETSEMLTTNAKRAYATDEDILSSKYFNSINAEMGELYAKKREIQNSDLSDSEKYYLVREIQKKIDALAKEGLETYDDVVIDGNYASVGDRHYRKTENGWEKLTSSQAEKQEEVVRGLGIEPSEYWKNKEEYDFAYENPGKYSIATTLGGYDSYKEYTSGLGEIRADKDAKGNSIPGSAKNKKVEYINGLDLDYGQKIILFKREYKSDNTYNSDIVEYLNNRDDISYKEMVTILKELGFEVSIDGTVSW
jgi:hypothetical protein